MNSVKVRSAEDRRSLTEIRLRVETFGTKYVNTALVSGACCISCLHTPGLEGGNTSAVISR